MDWLATSDKPPTNFKLTHYTEPCPLRGERLFMQANKPPDGFTGVWTTCDPGGGRCETEYVGGVANGSYRSVLSNGVCIREAGKKNGHWHGPMIIRNAEGAILDSSDFYEGTGTYRIFSSEGRLMDEVPMLHGKKHGLVRCWRGGHYVETRYLDGEALNADMGNQ
jgi:hypothetical protein